MRIQLTRWPRLIVVVFQYLDQSDVFIFFPVMYDCRSGVADILTMIGLYRVVTLFDALLEGEFFGGAICVCGGCVSRS